MIPRVVLGLRSCGVDGLAGGGHRGDWVIVICDQDRFYAADTDVN